MATNYVYPNVQLPSGCNEVTLDPALRSEMESGIILTRPRYTRVRRTWQLTWANMRGADYRTLRNFYTQMRGGALSFRWTHPREGKVFEVRFQGQMNGGHTVMDCWSVDCTLEEV